jgi:anti-sigma B factor antagonist
MAHLHISERADSDLTILDLAGQLGPGRTNIFLGNTLRLLIGRGQNQIILNLAQLSYIDGSGVRELIKGYEAISNAGGQLKVCSVRSRSLELIPLTDLSMVFELFECENSAIDSFTIRRNYFNKTARPGEQVLGLETIVVSKRMRTFLTQIG